MAKDEPEVDYEKMLIGLLKDRSLSRSRSGRSRSIPKIQRVQPYLRQRVQFEKNYSPKLLSLGPIHHGDQNLELGEHYKRRWTRAYFDDFEFEHGEADTERAAKVDHHTIVSRIEGLKKLYSENAIKEYKGRDNYLAWMLFVDGCAVLHIIKSFYDSAEMLHPADKLGIKIDQLSILLQDMLLLENQIPYLLLQLLVSDEYKLKESMLTLVQYHNKGREQSTDKRSYQIINIDLELPPFHLLDLLHRTLVGPVSGGEPSNLSLSVSRHQSGPDSYRVGNIQELKAAGINVKSAMKMNGVQAVNLGSGNLELPKILVSDATEPTLMNLTAYEMCPDFPNKLEITSYVAFLDLLINHPNDVKDLRKAGVLHNYLKNDEDVVRLFDKISTDLIADGSKCAHVKGEIEDYCKLQWKIWKWSGWVLRLNSWRWQCDNWMTEVHHNYFRSPWTFIALMGGVLGLGLTMVQTWFAIWPAQPRQK